jgi:hypothetical protein
MSAVSVGGTVVGVTGMGVGAIGVAGAQAPRLRTVAMRTRVKSDFFIPQPSSREREVSYKRAIGYARESPPFRRFLIQAQ